ncbi:MAG: hypothetical protein LBH04_02930 [Tannerellaceae bacterium]|nr:hypothetical protein [Tannerellaceae bacterium]
MKCPLHFEDWPPTREFTPNALRPMFACPRIAQNHPNLPYPSAPHA